jgi:AraC-like DNA-binding protein
MARDGTGRKSSEAGAERARHWRYEELPGVDLLRARYIGKTFVPHTHESYVIAAITEGVELFRNAGSEHRAGPGSLALINPDTPHTGQAGGPDGWRYSVLYPEPGLVAEIAAEGNTLRGTPGFAQPVFEDVQAGRMVVGVLRAADEGNALAADSLLRLTVARLLKRNGGTLPERTVLTAGARNAARARALLQERMVAPPTLALLAAELGTSPFALLRAFKAAYGMPPHTWLTDARVRAARALLDRGAAPAEVAVLVGFSDQPHLNRHFTRIVGVGPGAYRRERAGTPQAPRKNVQDSPPPGSVPSATWQNRQHLQHGSMPLAAPQGTTANRPGATAPSSGTHSASV